MNALPRQRCRRSGLPQAFTLVELLVSMTVLALIMVAVGQMTAQLTKVVTASQAKIEMFQEARAAFLTITQRIRQATLNTSWDYDDPNNPTEYVRHSNLHFVSAPAASLLANGDYSGHAVFFNAPLGYTEDKASFGDLTQLLNDCGYFVQYSQDPPLPSFLGGDQERRWRWRLKQYLAPSETSLVQAGDWTDATRMDWFQQPLAADPESHVYDLADNIVGLFILPVLPAQEDRGDALAPNYVYDSRVDRVFTTRPDAGSSYTASTIHQMPPLVRVIMVAIDEDSAKRLNPENSSEPVELIPADLFRDALAIDADLAALEESLAERDDLQYRVFDTTMALPGAKWSRN